MLDQLALPFPATRQEILAAARRLFDSWSNLRLWARCGPGCTFCGPAAEGKMRERHLAARELWRLIAGEG